MCNSCLIVGCPLHDCTYMYVQCSPNFKTSSGEEINYLFLLKDNLFKLYFNLGAVERELCLVQIISYEFEKHCLSV